MGISQGRCCEHSGRQEADNKIESEDQAMVTVECQDLKPEPDLLKPKPPPPLSRLPKMSSTSVFAEASRTLTSSLREDAEASSGITPRMETQTQASGKSSSSELAMGARVRTSGLQNMSFNNKTGVIMATQGERWIVKLDDDEGEKAFKVENLVAQKVCRPSDVAPQQNAEVATKPTEEVSEKTQEAAKQPEETKEAEPKAAAKKAAAKKAIAKTKAKAKAKAEAKAATTEENKPVAEAAPKKKIPMNAKEREAAWNALSKEEQTAEAGKLCKAIESKDMNVIGRLMKEGVKCDTRNDTGETALYLAAKNGDVDTLEFLISNCGASINFATKTKETALHAACKFDKKAAMEWLVSAGIDRNVKNKKGQTAADVATGETAKSEILQFKMTSKK